MTLTGVGVAAVVPISCSTSRCWLLPYLVVNSGWGTW